MKAIQTFLQAGHRVKVSIFFRGREMAFLDRGREVLKKVVAAVSEFGKVEMEPRMEGSYMRIMIAPAAETPVKKPEAAAEPKPRSEGSAAAPVKAQRVKKDVLPDADQI